MNLFDVNEEINSVKENHTDTMPKRVNIAYKSISVFNKFDRMVRLWYKIPAFRMILVVFISLSPLILQPILVWNLNPSMQLDSVSIMEISKTRIQLEKEISLLDKKFAILTPRSYYLVINTASNQFTLFKGTHFVRKDKCSTGSYVLLKNGKEQQWMFKTPKGEFRIQGKTTSPVWHKPDWAFIEEGLQVPPTNHPSRYEYGVLGDYALSLGHGYFIHGTLYQRFLGLPVTHGCVRVNDENLELIYKSLSVGSKVYIY